MNAKNTQCDNMSKIGTIFNRLEQEINFHSHRNRIGTFLCLISTCFDANLRAPNEKAVIHRGDDLSFGLFESQITSQIIEIPSNIQPQTSGCVGKMGYNPIVVLILHICSYNLSIWGKIADSPRLGWHGVTEAATKDQRIKMRPVRVNALVLRRQTWARKVMWCGLSCLNIVVNMVLYCFIWCFYMFLWHLNSFFHCTIWQNTSRHAVLQPLAASWSTDMERLILSVGRS